MSSVSRRVVTRNLAGWARALVANDRPRPFLPLDHSGWPLVKDLADEQYLSSPLFELFSRHPGLLPPDVLNHFQERREAAMLFGDYVRAFLLEFREQLGPQVKVLAMQGAAIQARVYPKDWFRPMGDLDLYFPDGGMDAARNALKGIGFIPWLQYDNVWKREGFAVDLHASPWGEDRIPARSLFAQSQSPGSDTVPDMPAVAVPSAEYLLFHTGFHSFKHGFSRMIWDLDLLLLWKAAKAENLSNHPWVRLIAHRLRFFWKSDCPQSAQKLAKGLGPVRTLILNWSYHTRLKRPAGVLLLMLLCPNFRSAIQYGAAAFLPPKDALLQQYGPRSNKGLAWQRFKSLGRAMYGR